MNRYLKLVNFEINRFFKIYLVLIGITAISQIASVIIESITYMDRANKEIYEASLSVDSFLQQFGPMTFQRVSHTLFFNAPIAICVVTLLIYVFFIWYRDWLGKNTFIYRLLMLPTERINVYLSKATAIILFTLGLLAVQIALLLLEAKIMQWMVPAELRVDMDVHGMIGSDPFGILHFIIPGSFLEFLINYGIGITAVLVVFTAVLFERSFRWKGIFLGGAYVFLSIMVFFSPLFFESFFMPNYFYPMEMLLLMTFTGLVVFGTAIGLGYYLLRNKIRV